MTVVQDSANSIDYPSDEILLQQIAGRDAAALEALYDRHAQTIYSLILRIVQDQSVAEEVLQETFWQVWQRAEQYQGSGRAAAWLYRIARNKALDQLRRQKARPTVAEDASERLDQMQAPPNQTVERQVEQMWNRQNVEEALAQIPDEQRFCLELAYFEGMSQRQIADLTQTPLGTIKTRVRMGLSKLERLLRTVGYREDNL